MKESINISPDRIIPAFRPFLQYWAVMDRECPLHPYGNINAPFFSLVEAEKALNVVRNRYPKREFFLASCGVDIDHHEGKRLDEIDNIHERFWIAQAIQALDSGMSEDDLAHMHFNERNSLKEDHQINFMKKVRR